MEEHERVGSRNRAAWGGQGVDGPQTPYDGGGVPGRLLERKPCAQLCDSGIQDRQGTGGNLDGHSG